jgi:hypothetical protein
LESGSGTVRSRHVDSLNDIRPWRPLYCAAEDCSVSLPGFTQLASLATCASTGAFGEGCVSGLVARRFPEVFAALYFPVFAKSYLSLHPPLQLRGGILHELFKNKGSSSQVDCYRDIMLGDVPGKCLTRHIRSLLVPLARAMCGRSQFGSGLNGGETAFAHLYVRFIQDYCSRYNQSVAFVFMDIVTAFAVLLRRILFDDCDSDEAWFIKLNRSGFSDSDIRDVIDVVYDKDWIASLVRGDPVSCFALSFANRLYTRTWFSQDLIPGVIHTTLGCMAGSPPADLIYAMAFFSAGF